MLPIHLLWLELGLVQGGVWVGALLVCPPSVALVWRMSW